MNNKYSEVLLVIRKNSRKQKLRLQFRAEDLHRTYCNYFQTILLFW